MLQAAASRSRPPSAALVAAVLLNLGFLFLLALQARAQWLPGDRAAGGHEHGGALAREHLGCAWRPGGCQGSRRLLRAV
jgi:hypothetical protein